MRRMQGRPLRLRKPAGLVALAAAALLLPASASGSSPIVVTNTGDVGPGSLREAIVEANASPGSTILFHIPTSDPGFNGNWFTITPLSNLPTLTGGGTTIDGATQTAFTGDTNPTGPEIEISGAFDPPPSFGLRIDSANNRINSIAIGGFRHDGFVPCCHGGSGIDIQGGGGNVVTGSYIGTDATGSVPAPNDVTGIGMNTPGNTIGGDTAGAGNVISGNGSYGVLVLIGADNAVIEGNKVGTNASGTAAIANGVGASGDGEAGIHVQANDASILDNLVSGNASAGIGIFNNFTSGTVIRGNLVGTNSTGDAAIPNGQGMSIGGANNTVGGSARADANVVSGNLNEGIAGGGTSNVFEGNYVGTNAAGSAALGNGGPGFALFDPASDAISGNLVSGNGGDGIAIYSPDGGADNVIAANDIGTDATGSAAIPNQGSGVDLMEDSTGNTIGGTSAGARNIISGNAGAGIQIGYSGSTSDLIEGNFIGTDDSGSPLGNGANGIQIHASGNTIGGSASGAANVIAFNGGSGVAVYDGTGNAVSRNSIFSNGGLGIDLGGDGVTPNDPGDTDTGPNNLQNFPVLTSAVASSGHLVVTGTIDTQSPQSVTLEFFANTVPTPGGDPSGYGEGATFLGDATPAADGTFSVALPSVAPGTLISATATDAAGNTSEFAKDIPAITLPTSADQCKNGGWQAYGIFKNQGDCVSYVATKGKNPPG